MNRIYNRAFRTGVGINLFLFLILNIASYIIFYSKYWDKNIQIKAFNLPTAVVIVGDFLLRYTTISMDTHST